MLTPATLNIVLFIAAPLTEIGLSFVVGLLAGVFLCNVLRRVEDHGRYVLLLVSMVLFLIGVAELLHISDLLTCMVCGVFLGNRLPSEAHELTNEAEKIFSPVILIFFVLFGASMVDPALILTSSTLIIITTILYVVGRSLAKYLGSSGGARIGGNPPTVQRYLGLTLFSQAGVAVGLSVVIADTLASLGVPFWGTLILGVIGLSTLIFQIFGPLAVKYAIQQSGETRPKPEIIGLE
jgi:Kef-type K+ transport system membrane component KefB